MRSLLYNFSVIILILGIILLVHHITKIYYQQNVNITVETPDNIYDSYVYQERPKTLFSYMFNNIGPWIGRTANPTDDELNNYEYSDNNISNKQNLNKNINSKVKRRTSPFLLFN